MPDAKRNLLIILIVAAVLIAIAAAIFVSTQGNDNPKPSVFMVYNNPKGDLSYTDSAYRGLVLAQKTYPFSTEEYTFEADEANTQVAQRLRQGITAQHPGLVIMEAYSFANLTGDLAKANPDTAFVGIDQSGTTGENIRNVEITSYGSSYLAGYLAASATKTGKVGIILGTQTPLLEAFREGFRDGSFAADPNVTFEALYLSDNTSGFSDPAGASVAARGMYGRGADIIYTAAGYSGLGVIEEAKLAPNRYVIGVDSDQTHLGPKVVIASAVKNVDRVVYEEIGTYLNGTFTKGDVRLGLADNATDLVLNPAFGSWNGTVESARAQAIAAEQDYFSS